MDKYKHITIIHEYYTPQHYRALYDCGKENGIIIDDYIVISLKRILKDIIKNKTRQNSIKLLFSCVIKIIKLFFLKNHILIVGIAPYNYLMNCYKRVFKKNICIYFTSCEVWDGSECSSGKLNNKTNFEKILKENFKYIACVSEKTEKEISFLKIPTKVVNHSINYLEYKNKSFVEEKKFIFFGQYIERKGIDYILRWFEENNQTNVSIDFYGNGPLKNEIQTQAEKDNRINECGFCSQNKLKNILCNYYFSLLPTHREPFGMSIIEAMAAGCPTLAANVIGPQEIIDDLENGIFFEEGNYEDFCKKMDYIINMPTEKYIILRNHATETSKKYDTNVIIKRWVDIINYVDINT